MKTMIGTDISYYSLAILLSLVLNVIVVYLLSKKFKFTKYEIIGALVYENIGIIVGAKLLTYFQYLEQYDKFNFVNLELSSYGGAIGGILCLIIFCLQLKKSFKDVMFLFISSYPMMYAIGKIGCFLVGCCYGIEYSGLGHIVYSNSLSAPNGISLFPVQIIETFVFLGIFFYMFLLLRKDKFNWETLGISFLLCGLGKFILDYFRGSHEGVFLSLNQVISLMVILIGIVIYVKKRKEKVI